MLPRAGLAFIGSFSNERERGAAAVATGTTSHIAWRRRSGPISCSFIPYYDLYFPGAWQLLVSK